MRELYDAGPQSGGRPPAPGRLAFVQAFVNSFFDLEERLGPGSLRDAHRLAALAGAARAFGRQGHAARMSLACVSIREGLRAELAEHNGMPPDPAVRAALREATHGLSASFTLDDTVTSPRPRLPPESRAPWAYCWPSSTSPRPPAAGRASSRALGTDCGWVFFDNSRNGGQHVVLDAGLRQPREGTRLPAPVARYGCLTT